MISATSAGRTLHDILVDHPVLSSTGLDKIHSSPANGDKYRSFVIAVPLTQPQLDVNPFMGTSQGK